MEFIRFYYGRMSILHSTHPYHIYKFENKIEIFIVFQEKSTAIHVHCAMCKHGNALLNKMCNQ